MHSYGLLRKRRLLIACEESQTEQQVFLIGTNLGLVRITSTRPLAHTRKQSATPRFKDIKCINNKR